MSRSVDDLAPRTLHILNGDAVREKLERSVVPGTLAVYADVLHEGPVPAGLSREQMLETRAAFIASEDWGEGYDEVLATLTAWDERARAFADYDEVVLWLEADLFDQLLLVRHLDMFAAADLGPSRLSMICIGEFPGVERFVGLGQLDADQLASLVGARARVTPDQLALGRAAWRAFTAPDPGALEQLTIEDTSALPFLSAALTRLLEEYPSTENGLGRTEQQVATLLAAGPRAPADLFGATYALEERPFMGDVTFWSRVRALATARHPLVTIRVDEERPGRLPHGEVRLADTGREVVEGRADWVDLNGVDRWIGGVRLDGPRAEWRWDRARGALSRASA
jgi:hypothetical protein